MKLRFGVIRKMSQNSLDGKIKTVSCRNFVTYEECVFRPNEYLNVIIGPNGTGKSTLVAAIVIGFGGEPKLLNRSTSLADYIKNGKTAATIAIEIYQTDNNRNQTALLERCFNSAGKSEFKIDSVTMPKNKFLASVSNFKVQIGNLCQFLPQDRVHDFAKMNPQELFANTIKSVCDQEVVQKFEEMKGFRSNQSQRKDKLARDNQTLQSNTARLEELKVVLERYTQRKEYVDKLKWCSSKLLWLEVWEIEKKLKTQLAEKIESQKVVERVEKEYSAVTDQQKAITQTKNALRLDMERKRSTANRLLEEINGLNNQVQDQIMQIKSAKKCLEASKRDFVSSRKELLEESAILEGMAQDLKNMSNEYGSLQKIKNQLHPLTEQMLSYRNEIENKMKKCSNINDRLDEEYTSRIQMLKNRIERAHNVKESKFQLLRDRFPNVFTAVEWLRQNEHLFQGKVYYPMLVELNIKSPDYAKYAENTIPIRDLLAFTCEEKADMTLLLEELCVKQKLGINTLYSPQAEVCHYKANVPIQQLSQYGFQTYLIDAIEGPPSIMNLLCKLFSIHQIPIGGEKVSQHTDHIPHNIRLYYGGSQRYDCSVSKYSGEPSLMQNRIDSKRLLMSIDTRQIEIMKKELSKLLFESDTLKNNCTKIQSEIKDIEVKCEELRNEKRAKEKNALRMKETIIRFNIQKEKVEQCKKNITSIPDAEEKFKADTTKRVKILLEIQKSRIKTLNFYQNALSLKKLADVKIVVYNQQSEDLEHKLRDINNRKQSARQTYDNIVRALTTSERKFSEKKSEAKSATNGHMPKEKSFPYKTEFDELPNSMDELKEHVNDFTARLMCMNDVDENSVKEYEEKNAENEALRNSIVNTQIEENDLESKIRNIFHEWYSEIKSIVQNLNQQFSSFMTLMSFVGEISLIRKDEYDFDSYGIQIMVQYRKEAPLQALDRCRQSGGERAVAIAVYSLSLQHITHVPFRCVDEINQGMDPRNERKIFEMLVQETTKDGRSQYFFVTPKLLPKLVHNKRMMVHIVFNGKFVKSGGLGKK